MRFFIKAGCTDSILKELLRLKEMDKNDLNLIGERGKIWLLKTEPGKNSQKIILVYLIV